MICTQTFWCFPYSLMFSSLLTSLSPSARGGGYRESSASQIFHWQEDRANNVCFFLFPLRSFSDHVYTFTNMLCILPFLQFSASPHCIWIYSTWCMFFNTWWIVVTCSLCFPWFCPDPRDRCWSFWALWCYPVLVFSILLLSSHTYPPWCTVFCSRVIDSPFCTPLLAIAIY